MITREVILSFFFIATNLCVHCWLQTEPQIVYIICQVHRRGYQDPGLSRSVWQRPHQDMPGIRELGDESGDMTRHAERTPLLDAATKSARTS